LHFVRYHKDGSLATVSQVQSIRTYRSKPDLPLTPWSVASFNSPLFIFSLMRKMISV
jgi:hypothetical protein